MIGADEVVRPRRNRMGVRLPRAGATTAYSFGDDPRQLGAYAWSTENAAGNDPPVGAKKPERVGLYEHARLHRRVSARRRATRKISGSAPGAAEAGSTRPRSAAAIRVEEQAAGRLATYAVGCFCCVLATEGQEVVARGRPIGAIPSSFDRVAASIASLSSISMRFERFPGDLVRLRRWRAARRLRFRSSAARSTSSASNELGANSVATLTGAKYCGGWTGRRFNGHLDRRSRTVVRTSWRTNVGGVANRSLTYILRSPGASHVNRNRRSPVGGT